MLCLLMFTTLNPNGDRGNLGEVWYAVTADFNMLPIWLTLAVLFWVALFGAAVFDQSFFIINGSTSVAWRATASLILLLGLDVVTYYSGVGVL